MMNLVRSTLINYLLVYRCSSVIIIKVSDVAQFIIKVTRKPVDFFTIH